MRSQQQKLEGLQDAESRHLGSACCPADQDLAQLKHLVHELHGRLQGRPAGRQELDAHQVLHLTNIQIVADPEKQMLCHCAGTRSQGRCIEMPDTAGCAAGGRAGGGLRSQGLRLSVSLRDGEFFSWTVLQQGMFYVRAQISADGDCSTTGAGGRKQEAAGPAGPGSRAAVALRGVQSELRRLRC